MKAKIIERFEEKVARSEGCDVWVGAKDQYGYGKLNVEGRFIRAHRFAWAVVNGPIPDGLHVLHSCDNPSCVKIAHLRLGTHSENMQEMLAKGRGNKASGDRHGMKKFGYKVAGERNGRYEHGGYCARHN